MTDLYKNKDIREQAEHLVRTNVFYCVSYLVSKIEEGGDQVQGALGLDYEDDLLSLLEKRDWDEPASDYIDEMERDDMVEYLEDREVSIVDLVAKETASDNELRVLVKSTMEKKVGGAQAFCDEFRIEPERTQVSSHWIVSGWLADKLEERGHPVARDFLGMTIWGRATGNQSIDMDRVMLEIARDLIKEFPARKD